jgi:hypothetical protein
MVMSELRDILKEEYKKKEEAAFNPQVLMEMIEEVLNTWQPLVEDGTSTPRVRTYHISEIPLIPISELGWANADDDVESDDPNVPPSQRRGLEMYLSQIPGDNFAVKLDNVSKILVNGINSLPKDNPKKFIQQAMAYLVFYKTLTMAITNFNASAAGFNFEAFLAALMKGRQIPASGAKTIADITAEIDNERVPVSLKLYNEKGLEVGGSFFDLSNDIIKPNPEWTAWIEAHPKFDGGAMRYVVCGKVLEGEGVEQEGQILFWQFDITRANYFRIMAEAGASGRECIKSNSAFMQMLNQYKGTGTAEGVSSQMRKDPHTGEEAETLVADWSEVLPAKTATGSSAELGTAWSEYIDNKKGVFDNAGFEATQFEAIRDMLVKLYVDNIEQTQSANGVGSPALPGRRTTLRNDMLRILDPEVDSRFSAKGRLSSKDPVLARANSITDDIVGPLFKNFKAEVIKVRDVRAQALEEITWVTGPAVVEWYEALPTPELKALAIKNTLGYLQHYHWVIPRTKAKTLGTMPGADPQTPFATLDIGAKTVMKVLEGARGQIMDEVFAIFDQVAIMSQKLNTFFADGLRVKDDADAAADAADAVGTGTRHIAGDEATGPPDKRVAGAADIALAGDIMEDDANENKQKQL